MMKKFKFVFLIIAAILTGSQAAMAQNWVGNTPENLKTATKGDINSTSEDANFFLYNVGTGKFLAHGGLWETQAVIKDVGLLLILDNPINDENSSSDPAYSVHTKYSVDTQSGSNYIGLTDHTTASSVHDGGIFFTDRNESHIQYDKYVGQDLLTLYFHKVEGVEGNVYNVYVKGNTKGSGDHSYYGSRAYLTVESSTINTSVTVTTRGLNEDIETSDLNSQWMLIPLSEVRNNFRSETANSSEAHPADGSYIIRAQNFSRNNNDLNYWRTGKVADNHRLSTDYASNIFDTNTNKMLAPGDQISLSSGTTTNYYVGNGYAINDNDGKLYYDNTEIQMNGEDAEYEDESHQKLYGGYWTANIQGPGTIWQKIYVPITVPGWYLVSCDGFTTATQGRVFLFAATTTTYIPNDEPVTGTLEYEDYALSDFNLNTPAPATYTAAGQMLITGYGYKKNVMLYINPQDEKYKIEGSEAGETQYKPVYLIMGVQATGEAGTDGEGNPVNADAWTCIDNFEIKYAGSQEKCIILDEGQTSIDYINKQVDTEKSYPMRLARTLDKDKWNSLILPVSLTAQQVKLAFGDNTKLSEKNADAQKNAYVIEFKSVPLNVDDNTVVLKAGTPYIIKPSIDPSETAGTFSPVQGEDMAIGTHYLINQVTLDQAVASADVVSQEYDCGQGGTLTFNGTYTTQSSKIPAGSYLLSHGDWYHMNVTVNTVKGFRTWLQPVTGGQTDAEMKFAIDGVVDGETTAIEGIENDANARTDNKVYNMNGQLVRSGSSSLEGLPKGVYIVNNKKYIVK